MEHQFEPELMIEAHQLRRTFGQRQAVADLSFSVRRGEIFGLLGPNGAGKTTTIRLLSGQIIPDSGWARVAGCDVARDRLRLKQRIGVVFEEQNLYERLSARANLRFSCWLYGLPEKRIDEVLTLVDLRDRAREPVGKFSQGLKQRLLIARALLHQPSVLFLDEPGRGLDPISAHTVRQVIRQLSEAGTTILLTTHLMEEADQLCQRVAFIVNGRLVANDTPRHLKLQHGKRLLQVTLEEQRDHSQRLCDITLKLDDVDDQQQLTRWLSEGRVRALHTQEASLEEVFFHVAGVPLS
ncbi:multidrug ABC transporter ATP-binding protein [Thermogemmatispora aurantia]|uniref:Multidrug ABC transporter ATP-binding protein n=1 Tax=Thermogemmatispora aurantia TaxID=2045279 RepID=A0A5J4KHN4_9CHLR|nr:MULTISPECIES: ABC transporter ATP-binding protein [Thermogemmatispora]GER85780.1 multidrug ABC transporter ATP-binding protein [Thermogemmatispora aurantia]